MWHRLRLLSPEPLKRAFRRVRSLVVDPLGRGILIEVSGVQARVPGYFMGGGRAGYELDSTQRFVRWLDSHPDGLVMDVGCSVSTYGIIALSSSPSTRVIAIDPDFASLVWTHFLCSKVENPGRMRLVHGFVVAEADPPRNADDACSDSSAELKRRSANPFAEVTKYQESHEPSNKAVPRHSIDALLGDETCAGGLLVKIDVEGNEMGVLVGAKLALSRIRPTLLVSVHPQFGVDVVEVRRHLESAGYSCEHFATDHEEHWWCEPRPTRLS